MNSRTLVEYAVRHLSRIDEMFEQGDDPDNLRVTHAQCNIEKGARMQ